MIFLIAPSNRKYAPYIEYYYNYFKDQKIEFKLVIWNREGISEECDYAFNYSCNKNILSTFIGYYKYSRFIKKKIKGYNNYKLVFFTTALAFFIRNILLKGENRKRYIIDIRDESIFEKKFPKLISKICYNSYLVVSSSRSYEKWIKRKVVLCHNIDEKTVNNYKAPVLNNFNYPITIVCAGLFIEKNANIKLTNIYQNDNDINFIYLGKENKNIVSFQKKIRASNINNVIFEGEYDKKDIIDIYRNKADFVNIIRQNTQVNERAIPNKMYDAILAGKPIIVFDHNIETAKIVGEYSLGCVIKESELPLLKETIKKYINYEYSNDIYNVNRSKFLNDIKEDIRIFKNSLEDFSNL